MAVARLETAVAVCLQSGIWREADIDLTRGRYLAGGNDSTHCTSIYHAMAMVNHIVGRAECGGSATPRRYGGVEQEESLIG